MAGSPRSIRRSRCSATVVEPLAVIDAPGDDVLVEARVTGRGRSSGFPVEWHHGYIWTVRDGVAVRFRWFNRRDEARAAVGFGDAVPDDAS